MKSTRPSRVPSKARNRKTLLKNQIKDINRLKNLEKKEIEIIEKLGSKFPKSIDDMSIDLQVYYYGSLDNTKAKKRRQNVIIPGLSVTHKKLFVNILARLNLEKTKNEITELLKEKLPKDIESLSKGQLKYYEGLDNPTKKLFGSILDSLNNPIIETVKPKPVVEDVLVIEKDEVVEIKHVEGEPYPSKEIGHNLSRKQRKSLNIGIMAFNEMKRLAKITRANNKNKVRLKKDGTRFYQAPKNPKKYGKTNYGLGKQLRN